MRAAGASWPPSWACRCWVRSRWRRRCAVGGDEGRPLAATDPDCEAAQAFAAIATDPGRPRAGSDLPARAYDSLNSLPLATLLARRLGLEHTAVADADDPARSRPLRSGARRRGAPIGRRVVLGMLGLGAVGVVAGKRVQDGLDAVLRPLQQADPTGLTGLLPGNYFRIYTVTDGFPSESDAAYRLTVDGRVDHPHGAHPRRTCRPCRPPGWCGTSSA